MLGPCTRVLVNVVQTRLLTLKGGRSLGLLWWYSVLDSRGKGSLKFKITRGSKPVCST